jgi:type IV pilus assembly protein PilN
MHFRLNLASRVYLDRRSVQRWLLLTGGLLMLLLAVNLLYTYRYVQQLLVIDGRLAEIDDKLAARRGTTTTAYTPENFARVKGQIGAANQIIDADQFRWTALLGRFEALLPEEVAIRSLQPNYRDRTLQVTAVARDTAAMTAFLDELLGSEDMRQAFLLNHALTEQPDGGTLVAFSIVVREAF